MRKVTKILVMVLSAIVMLLIILPLSVSLALTIPAVQEFAVRKVTEVASSQVGSRVSVSSVKFELPHSFTFNDIVVEDLECDTLLSANMVSARLGSYSPFAKQLSLKTVSITDASLGLRQMEDSLLNIKQLLDRITNTEKRGVFKTTIDEIEVNNLNFSLIQLNQQKPEYGVDLGNIVINNIDGKISNFESHQGVTQLSIEQFKGTEQSGFSIESLRGEVITYEGVLDISNLTLSTLYSLLTLPQLRLEADSWEEYKEFETNVTIELTSNASILSLSDIAYFVPSIPNVDFEAHSLTASLNGTVMNLALKLENLSFGQDSRFMGNVTMIGVTDINKALFDVDLETLETNITDIESIINTFKLTPLGAPQRQMLEKLGNFRVATNIDGTAKSIAIDASIETWLGKASYKGRLRNLTSSLSAEGLITASNINLGALLDNPALGMSNLSCNVRYIPLGSGAVDSWAEGKISSIGYNSYTYSDIDFEGSFDGEMLETSIVSSDSKLDFSMLGIASLGEDNHYDFTIRVNNADLYAMGINKRDSISTVSGSLRLNLGGSNFEDLSGDVTLRNINYKYNYESLYAPSVSLKARNSANNKFIELKSDYVDMTFRSRSSYDDLLDYVSDGIKSYVPILYSDLEDLADSTSFNLIGGYSTLQVNLKDFTPISNIISKGLDIADNSSLNVMIDHHSERFSMRLESDYIQHGIFAATDFILNAANDNDSLVVNANAADIFVDRTSFSSFTFSAGAHNNVIELSTGFRDIVTETSATLGMRVGFEEDNKVNIRLRPSNVTLGDDIWIISATGTGRKDIFEVNNFNIVNGDQQLNLGGIISKSPSDSLVVNLKNFDISIFTSIINDLGYTINGLSSGYINISEVLSNPRVVADVQLDSVSVNNIPSPALRLTAGWVGAQKRAKMAVTKLKSQDTVMIGYYTPVDSRYYAHLKVDSFEMSLIDPVLNTTIADTRGYADLDVTLSGEDRKATLHGGINIYDLNTRILYTQVEYNIPSAYIAINDNKLNAEAQTMLDNDGNQGLITLNLSLDRLSNVNYKLRIVPENMMVLNTTEEDNELFYGTIYATGVAVIEGDRRGVDMDITATSNANSNLFMPLSNQSSVANTDFITFVQRDSEPESLTQSSSENYRSSLTQDRRQNSSSNNNSATSVNISMALTATPDLDFQFVIDPVVGDIIKARGEGRLNLNIAPQDNKFEMYGDYNIEEGSYLFTLLNPISKRFVIDSGSSIQWTGDPLDPQLDIDAVYKVKTSLDPLINSTSEYSSESSSRSVPVDCIIHLGDRLMQPSVTFAIDVPTADTEQQAVISNTLIDQETISQQFFYLMFANSFVSVNSSYGNLNSSTTASTGLELITNQLSNWLSSNDYNVVIRYRLGSDVELTSDELDVGFSRGLIDNRLLIEVEGNYLADNEEYGYSTNFMADAYITWLIDKAGALRLKGFTQTIDRYDENQGLQETGIGIYYSESFNNRAELKRKIRERFRRKKRKTTDDDDNDDDDEITDEEYNK